MTGTAVHELRRYRLRPGKREDLIGLFERCFVETQEAVGMRVAASFRDLDDEDSFVWLRSFPDMEARKAALRAFYGGPVWAEHGAAANATMVNSDNVLLLRAAGERPPFDGSIDRKTETGAAPARGFATITIASLAPGTEGAFAAVFQEEAAPVLTAHGARIDATFVTDRRDNTFPRLPVRAGESVFVWLEGHESVAAHATCRDRLAADPRWTEAVHPRLDALCWRRMETARLTPTARSLWRWRTRER